MPITRERVTPSTKFVVRRDFKINGRDFKPGNKFGWRRLSIDWRKCLQLYDGNFIAPVVEYSGPFSVLKEMVFNGKQYSEGDTFYNENEEKNKILVQEGYIKESDKSLPERED